MKGTVMAKRSKEYDLEDWLIHFAMDIIGMPEPKTS
jgi:hypothetical protein